MELFDGGTAEEPIVVTSDFNVSCRLIYEHCAVFRSGHHCQWAGIESAGSEEENNDLTTWKPFCW